MKKIKTKIQIIFLVVIVAVSFFYIKNNSGEFQKIFDLQPLEFIIISIIFLLQLILSGLMFKNLLLFYNIKLCLKEWFGLTVVARYNNYLISKSGSFARGYFLKKIYNFPYKNYLMIIIFLSLIQVFCSSLLSLLQIAYKYYKYDFINYYLLIFFMLMLALSIIPFVSSRKFLILVTKKFQKLSRINDLWLSLRHQKKIVFNSIVFTTSTILLFSLRIYLIYKMAFSPILFSSAIIIACTSMLSFFISLTPAEIGIREAIMSYVAQLTGENFTTAMAVSSLDRIILIIWIFSLGFVFNFWFSNNFKTKNASIDK